MLKRSVHTSLDYKMETGYLQHNFGKRGCDDWKCTSELLKDLKYWQNLKYLIKEAILGEIKLFVIFFVKWK